MAGLNDRQQRFVQEYLRDLNGTRAAIRAGYAPKHAGDYAAQLLSKPQISDEIARAKAERAARAGIDADRVLEEIRAVALAKLSDVAEWDASSFKPYPSHETDPETGERREAIDTRAVKSVTYKTITITTDYGERTTVEQSITMHDKLGALDKLAKHLGIVVDRKEITGAGGEAVQVEVKARDYRDALGAFLPPAEDGGES